MKLFPRAADVVNISPTFGSDDYRIFENVLGEDFRIGLFYDEQGKFYLKYGDQEKNIFPGEETALETFADKLQRMTTLHKTFEEYTKFLTAAKPETGIMLLGVLYGYNRFHGEIQNTKRYSSRAHYFRVRNSAVLHESAESWKVLDHQAQETLLHPFGLIGLPYLYKGELTEDVIQDLFTHGESIIAQEHGELDPLNKQHLWAQSVAQPQVIYQI